MSVADARSLRSLPDPATPGLRHLEAPSPTYAILVVAFVGFGLLAAVPVIIRTGSVSHSGLGLLYTAGVLALQLSYFSRPRARLARRTTYAALVAQSCLVYLPILQYGSSWHGLAGFVGGSALIALPSVAAVPIFVVVVASMVTLVLVDGPGGLPLPYAALTTAVSTTIAGVVVYGLTRLARLVEELRATRVESSRRAVADERSRMVRDIHDLLGLSLSAITLKSELTHRLLREHPERASAELAEMLTLSRQALSDIRAVGSGLGELSIDDECRTATHVLTLARIEVYIRPNNRSMDGPLGTVMATVLREGVTNVLRHSTARWCEIDLYEEGGWLHLHVVNDGVPTEPEQTPGTGLQNLLHRAETLGGRLVAGVEPGRATYRLSVSVPLEPS